MSTQMSPTVEFRKGLDLTPRPEEGCEILNRILDYIKRFVALSLQQAVVVVLWIAHTHAFDAADCTPYLAINSAEKQSGKTRLLEVLQPLVLGGWLTGRASAAVLVRKIHAVTPTLLLDESDAAFAGDKEYAETLRSVLNFGYRRNGVASLCVGQGSNIDYKDFSAFCPKAIAGIGKLPDTVADRSIPIRLKRAIRGKVERYRFRDEEPKAKDHAHRLGEWCGSNIEKLQKARPEIPPELSDRQADACEPLLAIADLALGDWPDLARKALVEVCGSAQVDDDSIGVRLLRDTRGIFERREAKELTSTELVEELTKIETSPWAEWSKGKPLSAAKLARLLKPFEIHPGQLKSGHARGYEASQFSDAFSRYLASPPSLPPNESVKTSETRKDSGENTNLEVSKNGSLDTVQNSMSPNKDAPFRHFDTFEPGKGRGSAERQPPETPKQEVIFKEGKI